MGEVVDGQYQKYSVSDGAYIRDHFFGTDPELLELIDHLSDEKLQKLRRGGHDPEKVFAAFQQAFDHKNAPTVILAKTIKGYGLGEAGEGRNVAHNTKKIKDLEELRRFRDRFDIPISDEDVLQAPFYKPAPDSEEMAYLHARRDQLGGFLPARRPTDEKLKIPSLEAKAFARPLGATGEGKTTSTTQAYATILMALMKDKAIGDRIVPIIPDEARTFGMEAFFSSFGIYSSKGQLYEPVDRINGSLQYYKEAKDGQVLEEGINEAGAMGSFVAAGTAYANLGVNMIPFYIYYSMFGFQRVGDLIWLAADSRCKGFLVGGTSGRTTLNGEGLQHEDGHSHLAATTVPNLIAYDPAYGYELAVIIQDGLRRMYTESEDVFYYLSVYNEAYEMPGIPDREGVREEILKGMYRFSSTDNGKGQKQRPQLFGSGTIFNCVLAAQKLLEENYGIGSDVWSVTSYSEMAREAMSVDRWNRLHPTGDRRQSYLQSTLDGSGGPFIAASDNVRLVPDQIRQWVPGDYVVLGTDGFGRSDTRKVLRRHFEVDAECIAYATLESLSRAGQFDRKRLPHVLKDLNLDPDKVEPRTA